MTRIICDKDKCEYNQDGECAARVMHYAERLCQTYRKIKIENIMQPEHRTNCQKRNGKYKANSGRVLK